MNKKSKNKNRNKPTNPSPPTQKTEPEQILGDTSLVLVEEKPENIVRESDSVIETTSETTELVQENDEMPTDTPKKPKRNKGKKKKQEQASLEEIQSASVQDSITVPPLISDTEVKVSDESIIKTTELKVEEEDKNKDENISANVRKKKGKKKSNEQLKVEEPFRDIDYAEKTDKDFKAPESVTETNKTTKPDISTSEITESDTKQSKKKNKKKKHRVDSEKSDKADEVVVCTTAFQELISSADNEGDVNRDTHIELSKDIDEGDKMLSTAVKEETLKNLIENVLLPEETKQLDDEALEYDRVNESKSKKKSKKDKKQHQSKNDTEKSIIKEQIIQQETSVESSDTLIESTAIEQVECGIKDFPKTKAKIAKPVEKKRKEQLASIEDPENKLIEAESDVKEFILKADKKSEHTCKTGTSHDISENKKETKDLQLRNKNETCSISVNSSESIPTEITNPSTDTPNVAKNLNLADVNIGMSCNIELSEPSVITPDPILLKFDKEPSKPLIPVEIAEEKDKDISVSSEPYKTVEKKKKKHPKKLDVDREKPPELKVLVTPESEVTKEEPLQREKEDLKSSFSTHEDVEISSLKTDVGGLPDVTPDFIHHPLATSQQLIDNNNNMIIRDITSTDEKLNLHLLIPTAPIIQGSGETPEPVSEKVTVESTDLNVRRERSLTSEPEKTDLKSKMMEVNQDMEELRLSIERSLAELTFMEKSEQDIIKGPEEIQAPILVTTELKKFATTDDLCENILSENILQESVSTSEVTTNINKQEMLPKIENIQEKPEDTVVPAKSDEHKDVSVKESPPQVPARKEHKGKGKGKRKGKQEIQAQQSTSSSETTSVPASENTTTETKKEEKEQPKQESQSSKSNENKGKQQQQQTMQLDNGCIGSEEASYDPKSNIGELSLDPIENFEDALTSSVDDVNKTFEIIANEVIDTPELTMQNPEINITSPTEDADMPEQKQNPVSPPKNLIGHPDIPVPSNRTDYKKERNKPPNMRQAKVKIKDAVDIERTEKTKQSKESQTENKRKVANPKNALESFSYMTNESTEYVYKYSFRKVFLQSLCHVCRKELGQRVACQFCSLVFYCSQKHKDEDWPQHQSLCFAICTIAHLKDRKHIYADAKNVSGQKYRVLRMQMIISCEKVLKRKLVPWEQEALLYPRMCADVACREWKQSKLADCEGCGQISYCSESSAHLPSSHQRWCKSYALYQKLVHHQQTRGRLEPKLPTRAVTEGYRIPEKVNEILAAMYDEKIDMTGMEYAALTQLATGPLTAAYCHQLATATPSNGISKKTSFVVHIVGAELQFEADVLFKWEVFFLHLKPHVKELRVVLVSPDLNPSNLPLNLLEKVNLCESCRAEKRRVLFSFQDRKTYYEYWASDEFVAPDIVCAFNPSIQRSSMYKGKDPWPTAVSCILKLRTPLIVSAYSIEELNRDVARIEECCEVSGVSFKTISEPKCNPFASVRPDRNFITDDEVPLLFKNYCFVVLCGV